MTTGQVVVKGDLTFEIYGDKVRGYYLCVWDHSYYESQRIDIPLGPLCEALADLNVGTLTFLMDEIRPQKPPNPLQPTIRVQPR